MELVIVIVGFSAIYYLMLRPHQKRERERRELVRSLTEGDEVITNAGIHGVVVEVDANVVWLLVAPGVELKVLLDAVTSRVPQASDEETETAEASADDPDAEA